MIKTVRTWDELPPVLYDGDEGFSTRVLERKGRELERRLELIHRWLIPRYTLGGDSIMDKFIFDHPDAENWFDKDGRVK